MKIQITPEKKVDDALVVWHEETKDTDIVADIRSSYGLKFKPNSVSVIYEFGLIGSITPDRVIDVLKPLVRALKPGGEFYIIEQDFDYILRALIGGDLSLEEFNKNYRKTTYVNQDEIIRILEELGFPAKEQVWWQEGMKFKKKNSEIIIMGKKNNNQ